METRFNSPKKCVNRSLYLREKTDKRAVQERLCCMAFAKYLGMSLCTIYVWDTYRDHQILTPYYIRSGFALGEYEEHPTRQGED